MAVTPTPLLYVAPHRVLTPDRDWERFHLRGFSHTFTWEQDPLGGFLDTVQPVAETIDRETGDCEDYAVLAASYLLSETDADVRLAFLWKGLAPTKGHTVVATDDTVYSSGAIYDKTLAEYEAASPYTRSVVRRL